MQLYSTLKPTQPTRTRSTAAPGPSNVLCLAPLLQLLHGIEPGECNLVIVNTNHTVATGKAGHYTLPVGSQHNEQRAATATPQIRNPSARERAMKRCFISVHRYHNLPQASNARL
jgi:hypothetical protein